MNEKKPPRVFRVYMHKKEEKKKRRTKGRKNKTRKKKKNNNTSHTMFHWLQWALTSPDMNQNKMYNDKKCIMINKMSHLVSSAAVGINQPRYESNNANCNAL